jgi:hypothetical protein
MNTRAPLLTAFGSFWIFMACGGRASSPNVESDACPFGAECATDVFEPEPSEPPEAELPETVVILELRQLGDASEPLAPLSCEYESRIKVNLAERIMIFSNCEASLGGRAGSNTTLEITDADVAVIESAFAELRSSEAVLCTSAREVMTLNVSTDTRPEPELLLAGEDHSACALPRLEQHEFVTGLDELRAVLLSFRAP